MIDLDAVLDGPATPGSQGRARLGTSREGRPVIGFRLGHGTSPVSLIGGCHADEPIGPAMLDRLVAWLQSSPEAELLLRRYTFRVVPHTNPDGEARNEAWTRLLGEPAEWTRREPSATVPLGSYLRHVVRELPGEDLEFGFPHGALGGNFEEDGVRPEARAIATFLAEAKDYRLHGSFHGMAFAAGPWFLLEKTWIDRTEKMRDSLRRLVEAAGYTVHDIDRRGEKGFLRIDRGFTTRPDSRAMAAHFEARGEPGTAALFRPSSMDFVRSLGGDPLTLVSEMPLFLLPSASFPKDAPVKTAASAALRLAAEKGSAELEGKVAETGVRPMPIRDQMYFQLAFLAAALEATSTATTSAATTSAATTSAAMPTGSSVSTPSDEPYSPNTPAEVDP